MLNAIEVRDDHRAFDDLHTQVQKLEEMIQAAGTLRSVDEAVRWMNELKSSLKVLNNLKNDLSNYLHAAVPQENTNGWKDRIVVRKGVEFQSLRTEDVAYIFTENKLVFVVDKEGKKFLAHTCNLCDLMLQLNKRMFYRANRKYIININYIKKYRSCDRVKVEVELAVQNAECVVISQENSSSFKHWIENL